MSGDVFSGKLLPGEQILWSGQPHQGLVLRIHDVLRYPFVLFAIWETGLLSSGASWLAKSCGLFAIVSLCGITWPFLRDAYVRRQTHYAVTTSRVLIFQPKLKLQHKLGSDFKPIRLDHLPDLTLKVDKKGQGTIFFERPTLGRISTTLPSWTLMLDPAAKFAAIDDAERIFVLVQRAMHPA